MALLIAKSPRYRSSASLPARIGGRYADLRPSNAKNQAIIRLGRLLEHRADEMKRERDAAVVGDLYNRWRDEDRKQLGELLAKKGKDAVKLDAAYINWFDKSYGEVDKQAENGSQQVMLQEFLNRRRERSLDVLARYEAQELQRYKVKQEEAFINNGVEDAREAAFDDDGLSRILQETTSFVTGANPGASNEQLEARIREIKGRFLFANMQERISQNPTQALVDLEKYKNELGEAYYGLKSNLAGVVSDLKLNAAYMTLIGKHGKNFEMALQEISNPKLLPGFTLDERNKLYSRFSSLYAQREREEADQKQRHDEIIKDNDFEVWTLYYANQLQPGQLDDYANKRLISKETYRSIKRIKTGGTQRNNPYVVGEIAEKMGLGVDVRQDLLRAAMDGNITESSFVSMMKENSNRLYKEGLARLQTALQRSPADKYNPDRDLKYSEALDLYNIRVRDLPEGTTPIDIARDIVDNLTEDVRRTMSGLPRPRFFSAKEYTLETLSEAQKETIAAYRDNRIGQEEYSFQIKLIQKYIGYIKNMENMAPYSKEAARRIKK